jgi:hypothetical protein
MGKEGQTLDDKKVLEGNPPSPEQTLDLKTMRKHQYTSPLHRRSPLPLPALLGVVSWGQLRLHHLTPL